MKKVFVKLKSYDSLCLISIILLGIWQVLRCPDLPGLYLDAVNPDYLAIQMLFPHANNPNWTMPHSGIPLLGQLYHGTITVWLQLIIVGLFGESSLLTVRFSNIIYVVGICWVMHLILKRLGTNKAISFFALICIMLSPNVFSFIRTQYYIKLPGTLLLMLSIYFGMQSIDNHKHAVYLMLSGISLGIAFYSYFIFLFFAPAILLFCLDKAKKTDSSYVKDTVGWCIGFGCGSTPYVIGYSDLLITSTSLSASVKSNLVTVGGFLLVITVIFLACTMVRKYQNNKVFIRCCMAALILVFSLGTICLINLNSIINRLIPTLNSLEIAGKDMGVIQRIAQIFYYWSGVLENRFLEGQMLETTSTYLPFMLTILLLITFILTCILTITRKMVKDDWREILSWIGILLCYGICCIPFASRMGGQHFTPTFFITCMILILVLDSIWRLAKNKYIKKMPIALLGVFLLWSIINTNLLQKNLEFTGGRYLYSETINTLAKDALSERGNGKKNVYVFPEWGFWCGFDYLTVNQIPYMLSIDINTLKSYLDKGYGFRLCTWDNESVEQYINLLGNADICDVSTDTMLSRDGKVIFYIIKGDS